MAKAAKSPKTAKFKGLFGEEAPKTFYCSFCIKSQHEVAKLVDSTKAEVEAAIQKAQEAGHNEIFLRFQGVVIYEARKHPGTLYVKSGKQFEDTYFGKIVDGRFIQGRDCPAEMVAKIPVTAGTTDYQQFILKAQSAGAECVRTAADTLSSRRCSMVSGPA